MTPMHGDSGRDFRMLRTLLGHANERLDPSKWGRVCGFDCGEPAIRLKDISLLERVEVL